MSSKGNATDINDGDQPTVLPKLRFPAFREARGWESATLEEIAEFVREKIPVGLIDLENYISTENILVDYGGVTRAAKMPSAGSVTTFRLNDTLVSNIRPYLRKVWFADRDGGASNDVIVIRAKRKLLTQYFPHLLKNDSFIEYVMTGAKGVKMPRGDVASIKGYPTSYPTRPEQQKIADCLSSVDELIAAQTRKGDALKTHKKGLMLQLFPREGEAQPRLRFSEFRNAREWQEQKISALLVKSVSPVDVDLSTTYQEIGIRSHGKGIFHKELISGKALGEKKVFWVEENAFVLNIVFAWEQAVAVTSATEKGMIASHRFPMFTARKNKADVEFIKYFFLTKRGKELLGIASPGGAGRNKTLGQKEFENLEILLPSTLEEQIEIAGLLSSIDLLIRIQVRELEVLKTYKKGLMQQLFPSPEDVAA